MQWFWLLAEADSAAARSSWWGDNWPEVVALVVGAATLLVLVLSGVALPVSYWHMSNRPNVIVSPDFERGYASVRVRNDGRASARNVRIVCEELEVESEPAAEHFDVRLGEMHPRQELEYFVESASEVLKREPYVFEVAHDRWRFGRSSGRHRTERTFKIDFTDFRGLLTVNDPLRKLTTEVTAFSRTANATLRTLVGILDRRDGGGQD